MRIPLLLLLAACCTLSTASTLKDAFDNHDAALRACGASASGSPSASGCPRQQSHLRTRFEAAHSNISSQSVHPASLAYFFSGAGGLAGPAHTDAFARARVKHARNFPICKHHNRNVSISSTEVDDDACTHFAHSKHTHTFVGGTEYGFVDTYTHAILSNTTVILDDFITTLLSSTVSCAPLARADGSRATRYTRPMYMDPALFSDQHSSNASQNGHDILVRNPVRISIVLPTTAGHAGRDARLFIRRVAAVGTLLVFSSQVQLQLSSFHPGSSCGVQIASAEPYYSVLAATTADNTVQLDLLPAHFKDAFQHLDFHYEFHPDAAGEVARRMRDGLPVGDLSRMLPFSTTTVLSTGTNAASYGINWNGKTGTAAGASKDPINMLPGGLLTCSGCYAYIQATLNVNAQVCLITTGPISYSSYDTTNWAKATTYTSSVLTNKAPDCVAIPINEPLTADAGFVLEAFLQGNMGYNYALSSSPINAKTTTCSSGDLPSSLDAIASPSGSCVSLLLDWTKLPPIDLTASGFPLVINPYMRLRSAGTVTAAYDGTLQMGSSFAATVKFGGKLTLAGVASTPKLDAYSSAQLTASTIPTIIKPPTVFTASVTAVLFVEVKLAIWDSLPFGVITALQIQANLAVATRRQLRHETLQLSQSAASSSGHELMTTERSMQTAPTCAKASSVSGSITASIGISTAGATYKTLISAMAPVNNIMGPFSFVVNFQIMPDYLSPFAVVLQPTTLVSACLTAGTNYNSGGTTTGGGGTTTGGGGTTTGGGGTTNSATTSSPASSGPNGGAIAGAVVGAVVGAALLAFLAYWVYQRRTGKAPISANPWPIKPFTQTSTNRNANAATYASANPIHAKAQNDPE